MSLFDGLLGSCIHERNFEWFVEKVKGLPTKEEVFESVKKCEQIGEKAEGLVEEVQAVIDDATAAAKEEIRSDLSDSIEAIEAAEQNVLKNAEKVQAVIDDATEAAKSELQASISQQLEQIEATKDHIDTVKDGVDAIVENAVEVVKTQAKADIDAAFNNKYESLQTLITGELNNKKADLEQHAAEKVEEAASGLNTQITEQIENAVTQLESDTETRLSQAVTTLSNDLNSRISAKFVKSKMTIFTTDWSGNSCTKAFAGVTASSFLIVTYDPASAQTWIDNEIVCSGVASGFLTFTCTFVPESNIEVLVCEVK